MTRRWTEKEELLKRNELSKLYVKENGSIGEIATILNLGQSTVYDRLLRLGIKPTPFKKAGFNNKRKDISIPHYSKDLAEFIGILLGDGHLTPTQVTVTLGNKEFVYACYITKLIYNLFSIEPKTISVGKGHYVIYFGSTFVVRWLLSMGLVFNKVKRQVDTPSWIFSKKNYIIGFLRGFFDTDGSIYKLRFGTQLAFSNRSFPLLRSLRRSLILLNFNPSKISYFRIYLTRQEDILRFFGVVNPANPRHQKRYRRFFKSVGSPVGARGGL